MIYFGKHIIAFLEKASKNPYHIEFFIDKNKNGIRLLNLTGPILGISKVGVSKNEFLII